MHRRHTLSACGVSDEVDVTCAARRSNEPRRAGTHACGVSNVRCHRRCAVAAMRVGRALSAYRVSDESNVTGGARGVRAHRPNATSITSRSIEPRRAGTRACGAVTVRCYS